MVVDIVMETVFVAVVSDGMYCVKEKSTWMSCPMLVSGSVLCLVAFHMSSDLLYPVAVFE